MKKGHEEGLKMATSLLQEFELPLGLLPLADVIEVGYVKDTGYMWIVQKKKVEHEFKMISKMVSYHTEITGRIKGVKAKELMLWPPIRRSPLMIHLLGRFTSRVLLESPRLSLLMHLLLASNLLHGFLIRGQRPLAHCLARIKVGKYFEYLSCYWFQLLYAKWFEQ